MLTTSRKILHYFLQRYYVLVLIKQLNVPLVFTTVFLFSGTGMVEVLFADGVGQLRLDRLHLVLGQGDLGLEARNGWWLAYGLFSCPK
jgi:hypothetical protein